MEYNPIHYKSTIKGRSCTYFLKVKTAKTQRKYIELTESHKVGENNYEQKFIRIYEDDIPNLAQELGIVLTNYFGITNVYEKEDAKF